MQSYHSVLDEKQIIDHDHAIVAIARKPEKKLDGTPNKNTEHTFILIECLTSDNKVYFGRYELFIDNNNPGKCIVHKKNFILQTK